MTTQTERPDLTELIIEAPSRAAALEAITAVCRQDADYVAYFATGNADTNIEEAIALRALLDGESGIQALREALETIIQDNDVRKPEPEPKPATVSSLIAQLQALADEGAENADVLVCTGFNAQEGADRHLPLTDLRIRNQDGAIILEPRHTPDQLG